MSNSKFPQYKKNPKEKCIEQFNSIFIKNLSNPQNLLNNLKENSMSGEIEKNYIRSTSWNILLKTYELDLNITDTKQNLKSILLKIFNNRKKYKKKLKEITSLKKFSGDPLGGSKENDNKLESWNSFFDQGGIKHIISIDIDRTYQDVNLFLENSIKELKEGQTVTGRVISITSNGEIFVDIGYKADGIIKKDEYSYNENTNPADEFKIGDSITADIIKMNDGMGNVVLSYKRAKSRISKNSI